MLKFFAKNCWIFQDDSDDGEDDDDDDDDDGEDQDDDDDEKPKGRSVGKSGDSKPSWTTGHDVSENKTVFMRNLNFDSEQDDLRDLMEENFGKVMFAVMVMDKATDRPKVSSA